MNIQIKPDMFTDEQLIELIRLRLENEKYTDNILDINIKHKYTNSIAYRVTGETWGIENYNLTFNKFYLNEFKYIQREKII